MRESQYQAELTERILTILPGCMVIPNNPKEIQGIPDRLVLYGPYWAMLEVKKSENEPFRPNQEWYLETFNRMSFAACIYPENEEEVLDALQSAFGTIGQTCFPES
jgi:hypothetical protein